LDWWRVREALKKRKDWVYCVLTFVQPDNDQLRFQTYLKAGKCWDLLRKKLTWRYDSVAYIQTWERHAKGGIHVNLLISNQGIFEECCFDRQSFEELYLAIVARECGFGWICHAEPLRTGSSEAMAGYLVKLAAELTGAGGKNQIPFDAPPHFRRLRASAKLLPPIRKSGLTGWLVNLPMPAAT